tara:strand:+ start:3773 stop:4216 length:444 start_codon:yes stop_codon:yes gene_type:complete
LVAAKAVARPDQGTLVSNLEEGEIFLKKEGQAYRLVWTRKEKARGRVLEEGQYTFLGFRARKGEWFLSAAGGRDKIRLKAGETTQLALDLSVKVEFKAQQKRTGAVFLGMGVLGDRGKGVSIYREGKRVRFGYRLAPGGASGSMNYG